MPGGAKIPHDGFRRWAWFVISVVVHGLILAGLLNTLGLRDDATLSPSKKKHVITLVRTRADDLTNQKNALAAAASVTINTTNKENKADQTVRVKKALKAKRNDNFQSTPALRLPRLDSLQTAEQKLGPSELTKPRQEILRRALDHRSGHDSTAVAQQNLASWLQTQSDTMAAQRPRDKILSQLESAIEDGFIIMHPLAVSALSVRAKYGLDGKHKVRRSMDAYREHIPVFSPSEDAAGWLIQELNVGLKGLSTWLNFCGGAPPELSRLQSVVEIDHNPQGMPVHWRTITSSGDGRIDEQALASIKDSVVVLQKNFGSKAQRNIEKSRWGFDVLAYRVTKCSKILSPGYKPPGQKIEALSNMWGEARLIREVRLLALKRSKS